MMEEEPLAILGAIAPQFRVRLRFLEADNRDRRNFEAGIPARYETGSRELPSTAAGDHDADSSTPTAAGTLGEANQMPVSV
jgi:hypothetical protein